mmetsp:Transcript_19957/g.52475  ORF Transcript_19957/g.52475 Transcript_19957/m.52475 type:complete len:262 (-) Transcript_19957:277-1062(-)
MCRPAPLRRGRRSQHTQLRHPATTALLPHPLQLPDPRPEFRRRRTEGAWVPPYTPRARLGPGRTARATGTTDAPATRGRRHSGSSGAASASRVAAAFSYASSVRPSSIELQSATFQKRTPTGRSRAAATLVHSSSHLKTALTQPLTTSQLKPSDASYAPRERQKILGVVLAPTTPSGYESRGLPSWVCAMLCATRWPLTSAVWPSLSSRESCDIMSPTAKMLGWPASCSWSLTTIESRKPNALLNGDSLSIAVLGITPTHL